MQVKGHAAPETIAAAERSRFLIEQAEALGEEPEDPLLLFSVLYGFWVASHAAFKSEVMRALAAQFLMLAEKQRAVVPLMVGHRLMGSSLALTGDLAEGRAHYDQAVALYDPAAHRSLTTRFGQDVGVANLAYRSLGLLFLGYPEAAQRDADDAVRNAREIGHGATLILALIYKTFIHIRCGSYATANVCIDELRALAEETGALFWRVVGGLTRGCIFAETGKASEAVPIISTNLAAFRSTGTKMLVPLWLEFLSKAQAHADQLDAARRSIGEAMEAVQTTGERWAEAEVHRTAGEIALIGPKPDAIKAEACFDRALSVARQQQAKFWELRAAMSMARLWRGQGKPQQARELLAPVYGWFTEGFDTLDLKEAKALLDELHA
jgi:predicted ATPase